MQLHRLAVAAVAALLMAPVVTAPAARAELSETGKQAITKAGQIMFEHRCRSCHADDPAAKSYGPSLIGVVGRKAGSVEGFTYSDALKSSGLVWTDAALKAWMADNKALMPGTRMRHVGITDAEEQEFILAYLKSLSK
jgi:cytochrome c